MWTKFPYGRTTYAAWCSFPASKRTSRNVSSRQSLPQVFQLPLRQPYRHVIRIYSEPEYLLSRRSARHLFPRHLGICALSSRLLKKLSDLYTSLRPPFLELRWRHRQRISPAQSLSLLRSSASPPGIDKKLKTLTRRSGNARMASRFFRCRQRNGKCSRRRPGRFPDCARYHPHLARLSQQPNYNRRSSKRPQPFPPAPLSQVTLHHPFSNFTRRLANSCLCNRDHL